MTNVYVELRPKGRPEGSPLKITWSSPMPTTRLPPSKHNMKPSSGLRKTVTSRTSRASVTSTTSRSQIIGAPPDFCMHALKIDDPRRRGAEGRFFQRDKGLGDPLPQQSATEL